MNECMNILFQLQSTAQGFSFVQSVSKIKKEQKRKKTFIQYIYMLAQNSYSPKNTPTVNEKKSRLKPRFCFFF